MLYLSDIRRGLVAQKFPVFSFTKGRFFKNRKIASQHINSNDCFAQGQFERYSYNTVNPGFSPEGTCVLSFTAMYSDDAWKDVSQEDYLNKKYELADKLIADYESRLGISIRDSIEEIDIASPWTLARYVGVPNGCIYGYEADEWDGVLPRMLDYAKANPIPGLRFCGASDFMGDGYGPANLSGDVAARMTLRDMQKEAAK